jgi:hypothetical protein
MMRRKESRNGNKGAAQPQEVLEKTEFPTVSWSSQKNLLCLLPDSKAIGATLHENYNFAVLLPPKTRLVEKCHVN